MRRSIGGLQCFVEGAHVTNVSIPLCPLGKFCPPIILHGPKLSLECTAGSLVCGLCSLIIRFCKQIIVAGAFLFEQLLDFLISLVKPVLVFSDRRAHTHTHRDTRTYTHTHAHVANTHWDTDSDKQTDRQTDRQTHAHTHTHTHTHKHTHFSSSFSFAIREMFSK